ncbi:hypothetical protein HOD29_02575 [archaeon]|jgi:hypothetical protein|nr:hypothetical protein [archaeon]
MTNNSVVLMPLPSIKVEDLISEILSSYAFLKEVTLKATGDAEGGAFKGSFVLTPDMELELENLVSHGLSMRQVFMERAIPTFTEKASTGGSLPTPSFVDAFVNGYKEKVEGSRKKINEVFDGEVTKIDKRGKRIKFAIKRINEAIEKGNRVGLIAALNDIYKDASWDLAINVKRLYETAEGLHHFAKLLEGYYPAQMFGVVYNLEKVLKDSKVRSVWFYGIRKRQPVANPFSKRQVPEGEYTDGIDIDLIAEELLKNK